MKDLMIVMPVYNERECILRVINSWLEVIANLNIDCRILVLNDGSDDGTRKELEVFEDDSRVQIVDKDNSGHGPTLLMGYKIATEEADWVFQCDSDNEMSPECFGKLWEQKDKYDALFGARVNRIQSNEREFITKCSRLTVEILFGSGVKDVNTPYRLIRSRLLNKIITQVPENTFAPNVIISGAITKSKQRILEIEVPHEPRKTGESSITRIKLWKHVINPFLQILVCRPRI
jgi:glycosyltransferase involved in cell wall biosynthesis